MGRPRKPLATLEASGATKKNPQRFEARQDAKPAEGGIGPPPAEFCKPESPTAVRHLRIWHELIEQAPPGVLTASDRMILANACRIQAQIEVGKTDSALFAQLRAHLSEMGMTPAGRTKVHGGDDRNRKPASDNPWSQVAAAARGARAN